MIIDHQDFSIGCDLGVVEADGLYGEINTIVVVERRHAYGEKALRPGSRRLGDRGAGRKQVPIEQFSGVLKQRRRRSDLLQDVKELRNRE